MVAISPVNMVSGFAAAGTHPFNPNVIPLQAYISGPILSQSVGTQNGDQSTTRSVFVMKKTSETTQLIENTSDSIQSRGNTSQTVQVLKDTTKSVPFMEYSQNSDTGPIVDFQADTINQSQIIDMAEVHRSETESSIALELPILKESGIQTFTLPVSFDNQDEPLVDKIELNNITLEETNEVLSDLWNSELEAIFFTGVPS